jgi:thymidine kinase
MNNLPSIDLIIGPMCSGKSSELIRRLNIYSEMDMSVLYVNSACDTRSDSTFSTHNGTIGKLPFTSIKVDVLDQLDISGYDVIGLDEAQFFKGLKDTVLEWVDGKKKIVLVAGLNGDYNRKPFGEVLDLVSYCDTLTKLNAFCIPCKDRDRTIRPAHFTKRITSDDTTVLIGGKEMYKPVCRECFEN